MVNEDSLGEALEDLHHEDDMRSAFIAGVGKGVEIACSDQKFTRREFNSEIREAVETWLEEWSELSKRH